MWGASFEDRIAMDCYTRSLGTDSSLDLPCQAFQRALRAFEATLLDFFCLRVSESRCWRRFCLMRAAEQSITGVCKRWGSLAGICPRCQCWCSEILETSGDILEMTGQEFQANSATWQKAFTIWKRRRKRRRMPRRPSKICQGKLRQAVHWYMLGMLRALQCLASSSRINQSIRVNPNSILWYRLSHEQVLSTHSLLQSCNRLASKVQQRQRCFEARRRCFESESFCISFSPNYGDQGISWCIRWTSEGTARTLAKATVKITWNIPSVDPSSGSLYHIYKYMIYIYII